MLGKTDGRGSPRPASSSAGPLLGGLIVSSAGWRAVFWINPPVVAVCPA